MGITGVPTTRTSELLVAQRMLAQLRSDQADLFKLQNQISTGRRVELPSDDAPAALRAIGVQRLMERKVQSVVNLKTSQSFLGATDTALAQSSQILADVRGAAVAVADTTSSDQQRAAAAFEVRRSIDQLLDAANQNYRGRYLFAGSRTDQQPFSATGEYIKYSGNEQAVQSFADVDLLFDTNATGQEVFGAISEPVRGTTDTNPIVTASTKLSDLLGGVGVTPGSIEISDGTNTRVVDLSRAHTVGDVAALIEANPPAGRRVAVTIKPTGLDVALDSAGGQLTIREVGGGSTATSLGILQQGNFSGSSVSGADLNPRLTLGTSLQDFLGVRARAVVNMAGANNDLAIDATKRGPEFNGVAIQLVDDRKLQAGLGMALGGEVAEYSKVARAASVALTFDGGNNDLILKANQAGLDFNNVTVNISADVVAGNPATATYDAVTKTLNLHVEDDGSTTAAEIATAIAGDPSGAFTATLDASVETTNTGAGAVGIVNNATFATTGNSGGADNTLYVHVQGDRSTATKIAEAINTEGTFRAALEGHDSLSSSQAGTGLVDVTATAVTADGSGVEFDQEAGLQITNGGKTTTIDISSAKTVEDLLNLLNGSTAGLSASINSTGTGIDIRSRLSGGDFSIAENGGLTATQLGVRTFDLSTPLAGLNRGLGIHLTDGPDFTIQRKDGVELAVDLDGAITVGDVLKRINEHPDNQNGVPVVARLVDSGNGIELVNDDPTGEETLRVIPAVQGQAAQDLGLVPMGAEESVDPIPGLPATAKVELPGANNDLTLTSSHPGAVFNDIQVRIVNVAAVGDQAIVNYDPDTKVLSLDVDPAATTANTLANAINAQGMFTAALDTSTETTNDGTGLVTAAGAMASTDGGRAETLQAGDVNPQETAGVFNTLQRLAKALESNDMLQIERTLGLLDEDQKRLSFARAEVGARQQGLDTLQARLDQEEVELKSTLSDDIEVDIVGAISAITAKQASFEAALRSSAVMSGLSLLKFL